MLDIIAKLESASNSADRMGDVDVVRTAFVKELISDLRAENEELKRLDRERLAKLDQIKNGIETLTTDKKALAEALRHIRLCYAENTTAWKKANEALEQHGK